MSRPADLACPVCETEFGSGAAFCPRCGMPAIFQAEARRALSTRDPYLRPAPPAAPSRRMSAARSAARRDREPVEAAIEALDERVALLRRLEAPTTDASLEVQRAARSIMQGNSAEAVRAVQAATARAEEAVNDLVERRLRDLASRRTALEREGFAPPGADEAPIRSALRGQRAESAVDTLIEVEGEIGRFEVEVRNLRVPLAEADAFLELCDRAGLDTSEERSEVRRLRASIAESPEALAHAASRAHDLVATLREHVPAAMHRELDRHGTTLEPYPGDHPPAVSARGWHSQARDHLEQGRLAEAAEAIQSLRSAIESLGPVPLAPEPPAPAAVPDAPDAPGPAPPPEGVSIPKLLETARRLAARVRGLPPESILAEAAAAEIRRATAFLKARELEQAEATLTGLMDMLDQAEGLEVRGAAP